MVQAGVRFLVSSDAGIAPPLPHTVLPFGIAPAAQQAMGNAAALAAVTSGAAACGLGHRKGRIAAGFDIDLLTVPGDPLDNIDALHHFIAVIHCGAWVTQHHSGTNNTQGDHRCRITRSPVRHR